MDFKFINNKWITISRPNGTASGGPPIQNLHKNIRCLQTVIVFVNFVNSCVKWHRRTSEKPDIWSNICNVWICFSTHLHSKQLCLYRSKINWLSIKIWISSPLLLPPKTNNKCTKHKFCSCFTTSIQWRYIMEFW